MPHDTGLFLKAGSGIDEKSKPPASFIKKNEWLNINALMRHKFSKKETWFFRDICDIIGKNPTKWK